MVNPTSKEKLAQHGNSKSISGDDIRQLTQSILTSLLKNVQDGLDSGKLNAKEIAYSKNLQQQIVESEDLIRQIKYLPTNTRSLDLDDGVESVSEIVKKFMNDFDADQNHLICSIALKFLCIGYLGGLLNLRDSTLTRIAKEKAREQTEPARRARWKDEEREKSKLISELCTTCARSYLDKIPTNTITMYSLVKSILPDVEKACKKQSINQVSSSTIRNHLRKIDTITNRLRRSD